MKNRARKNHQHLRDFSIPKGKVKMIKKNQKSLEGVNDFRKDSGNAKTSKNIQKPHPKNKNKQKMSFPKLNKNSKNIKKIKK